GGEFQPGRRHQGHLGAGPVERDDFSSNRHPALPLCWEHDLFRKPAPTFRDHALMLSRTADSIYWLARYVERAEYLARILEATQRLTALPLAYTGSTNQWESAVATAGCTGSFYKTFPEANEETVTEFLAFATANPASIRNCFEIARGNA